VLVEIGPGRHRWRTPDPTRPTAAFFVLTSPVEVSFDMETRFLMPTNGQPVRLRGTGSLQVRCTDPVLLIAQFVGLPFDNVNEGLLRSVSRSVERMLACLLTRRVVMAGTPQAVTDAAMLPNIIEELVAYNPAAGAVFGIELMRMGHLTIAADDGSKPWPQVGTAPPNGETQRAPSTPASMLETVRSPKPRAQSQPGEASGEIVVKKTPTPPPIPTPRLIPATSPPPRKAGAIEVPATDEVTQPGVDIIRTPLPGSLKAPTPPEKMPDATPEPEEPRGSILGIGVSHIGSGGVASGEIPTKVAPGARVLVPGPNGLMQSATVRQLLQGYYELEVGGSGETIWVPINGVVPE
jgi:hypothetical protein